MASIFLAWINGEMKIPSPYKCDYCPKVKGETNHWFLAFPGTDTYFGLYVWGTRGNSVSPDAPGVEHICSQECAGKALSKWMDNAAK